MSQRWKYQLKFGLPWGSFMAVTTAAFTAFENEDWGCFLSWSFVARMVIFNAVGVFVLAYFMWKDKEKALSENKK